MHPTLEPPPFGVRAHPDTFAGVSGLHVQRALEPTSHRPLWYALDASRRIVAVAWSSGVWFGWADLSVRVREEASILAPVGSWPLPFDDGASEANAFAESGPALQRVLDSDHVPAVTPPASDPRTDAVVGFYARDVAATLGGGA